ncbi:MAG: peptidoglycan editing factor PgeF [Alphaproteobacteria bacterium]|nr:peptidoglycan editing factor PgeF [Alphaproteobacteria bacterium]MBU6471553.1 peptidoglycan editing factor PgeF [Alphaproteobacteria bacterium]MDE2013713.1 peptidoglycan editing factor PgeF [Alphaproteobacteria bacterium]MDE2351088.1 peptidoglycan editing factor PgeF [Alphaproteobacteria bacterium]
MLILRAENLTHPGIAHGFFGRTGGVSTGIFASLNCGPGSGDTRARVIENRRRVAEALAPGCHLLNAYQVHSPKAVVVTEPWELGNGPKADALVTAMPGLALGILTADCAPMLFADPEARVIGATHAGWKGALGGVVEATATVMESLGARRDRIRAAIGPCISQANYEVGAEFRDRFIASDPANAAYFIASDRPGHLRFNLEAYVAARAYAAGITDLSPLGACTYARREDFFSYRRTTHAGEADYGRQVSAIVLND